MVLVSAGIESFDYDENLYLSSGNRVPASIYKVATGTGAIARIFDSPDGSIAGLVFRDGRLYYADWRQNIYRLDLGSGTRTVYYTNPARIWLSDVGFKEMGRRRQPAGSRNLYEILDDADGTDAESPDAILI